MKHKFWLVQLLGGLLLATMLVEAFSARAEFSPAGDRKETQKLQTGTESESALIESNYEVSNVLGAFDKLTYQGEWLGYHIGPFTPQLELFPKPFKHHVQGMARSSRTGGPPIFYFAVSGDPADPNSFPALLAVEMKSLPWHGERLGSNRFEPHVETPMTSPPEEDKVIWLEKYTDFKHPSGIAMVGDILAVPMGDERLTNGEKGHAIKVVFYDCSDPRRPKRLDYELHLKRPFFFERSPMLIVDPVALDFLNNQLTAGVKDLFAVEGYLLSDRATLSRIGEDDDNTWIITDSDKKYHVYLEESSDGGEHYNLIVSDGRYSWNHGAQAVAVTKIEDATSPYNNGRFLLVTVDGAANAHFHWSSSGSFNDPDFEFPIESNYYQKLSVNTAGELKEAHDGGNWPINQQFQNLALVNRTNGELYLIAARNSHGYSPAICAFDWYACILIDDGWKSDRSWFGRDEIYLAQITNFDLDTLQSTHTKVQVNVLRKVEKKVRPLGRKDYVQKAEIYYYSFDERVPDLVEGTKRISMRWQANFHAGATAYVSPSGELLFYGASHWADGNPDNNIDHQHDYDTYDAGDFAKIAEFSPIHMTAKSRAPCGVPADQDNLLGGPHFIEEGSGPLELSGELYNIEPWVRMFQHANEEGAMVTMAWRDQWPDEKPACDSPPCTTYPPLPKDDFDKFSRLDGWENECREYEENKDYDGFSNCMSSFAWCGPDDTVLTFFDGEDYKVGNKANKRYFGSDETYRQSFGSDFNDQAGSVRIFWCKSDQFDVQNEQCTDGEYYPWDMDAGLQWTLGGDMGGELKDGKDLPDVEDSHAVYTPGPGGTEDVVTVTFADGSTATTAITVINAAPTLEDVVLAPGKGLEGDPFTISGKWHDNGALKVDLSVSWGDGVMDEIANTSTAEFSFSHAYGDNGNYDVEVCADDGEDKTCQIERATVYNVIPVLDPLSSLDVLEGDLVSLPTATFGDPGFLDTHIATVAWGDGTPAEEGTVTFTAGSGAISASHVYADNDIYDVQVCIMDDDVLPSDPPICQGFTVTAANAIPTIVAGEDQNLFENAVLELDPATFIDKGTLDSHTATITWGDGSPPERGAVDELSSGPPGSSAGTTGEIRGRHRYTGPPGIYILEVCVRDDDMTASEPAVCDTLQVTAVHGFMRFGVYANEKEVQIEENAQVTGSVGGEDNIELKKNSAITGDLFSGGDVKLEENSIVGGSVYAAGKVEFAEHDQVVGDIVANSDIPFVTQVDFSVKYGRSSIKVKKGRTYPLDSGSYRRIHVQEGGTLKLIGTRYAFHSIKLDKNSTVQFANVDEDPVVIAVRRTVDIQEGVQMEMLSGEAKDILFKIDGSNLKLGKSVTAVGTYLVPNGHIDMEEDTKLTGLLYGEKVQIKKGGTIVHVPALTPFIDEFLLTSFIDEFLP